jgi:hypothetical protein
MTLKCYGITCCDYPRLFETQAAATLHELSAHNGAETCWTEEEARRRAAEFYASLPRIGDE